MKTHRLAVDIGGTFTDVVLEIPGDNTTYATAKTPTTPEDPVLGAMKAIRTVLDTAVVAANQIGVFIHGTTLATNTLIEKKGAVVGAVLTTGFRDILEIGYERRYNQDDLFVDKPDVLVPRERCLTVKERISAPGDVLTPLDHSSVDNVLKRFEAMGVQSIAVCLIHAYANATHENQIARMIQEKYPDVSISLSSGVSPEIREYDRLSTTVANAYVKPLMASYLNRFEESLKAAGLDCPFFMMTSAGGMTTLETAKRFPVRLVESGPCGGAILAARVAQRCGHERVLSFDMGGTTAKFSMIDNYKSFNARNFEIVRAERFIKGSGMPVRIPAIEMIEIGAGGGSVANVDSLDRITIGPQSLGAVPGPACFGRGGDQATVTDADVVLGNIDAEIFTADEVKIDNVAAQIAVERSVGTRLDLNTPNAAYGILRMVSENMANAARVHAAERGTNLIERTMIAFGGNGPLHATRAAKKMGVSRIIIPPDPGVGSAIGFLSAPISYEIVSSFYTTLDDFDFDGVNRLFDTLYREAFEIVSKANPHGVLKQTRTAFMRYSGQGHEIEVPLPIRKLTPEDLPLLLNTFDDTYREQFKRTVPGMRIEIMNWAITVATKVAPEELLSHVDKRRYPLSNKQKQIYFGGELGWFTTPIFHREQLAPGDMIDGPALIVEAQTSTLIETDFRAMVDGGSNLVLDRVHPKEKTRITNEKVITQQLMWSRLLAVVEEQAQALMRSAFSPIVRECGDISAGIFDRHGRMLAQAVTGTPGHINTMANGVANFLNVFDIADMSPGDIYVTNDPWLAAGHLNDFMLVQPVFKNDQVIAFTSCTSHLIDVGGLCMGPEGSDIYDEGILIPPCKLVTNGDVNNFLLNIIKANSRQPIENEGDLYALIACCEVGTTRLLAMLNEYGMRSLDSLADHIINSSKRATVAAIKKTPNGVFEHVIRLDGYDFEIELSAKLTIAEDEVTLDLSGSSPCSIYGINVPLNYATAYAVFAIRCVMGTGIPNNAGSLAPFKIIAPTGCIVNAVHPAPVAMRHTVGQLLPDLVFGCLHQVLPMRVVAEGASCMYDVPMRSVSGNRKTRFAIELVHNGGTGARPIKDGLSATAYPSGVWGSQIEVTECTVPLLVHRRELRPDSGGAGQYRGGLGQTIEIESSEATDFLLFLSVDRLKFPARGRSGGAAGAPGQVKLRSGKILPGRGQETVCKNDRLIMHTPGGGGHGHPFSRNPEYVVDDVRKGLVSIDEARNVYGVTLDAHGNLNIAATHQLRGSA